MTNVFHYEEFETNSGQTMFIEQYGEKPLFVKFWRYGVVSERYTHVYSDMLYNKPRKKVLIEKY